MKMTSKNLLILSVAGPALCMSGMAYAQDAAEDSNEIIVTAEKRAVNIQDVPAGVNVVGGEEMQQFHVSQLSDISAYVPGLQVNTAGSPGQTTLSLRGISPIGRSSTVASYVDETPIGATNFNNRGSGFSLDLLPYDVERLEVLQGPQGTLYGAQALGGAIKYVLTDPNLSETELRFGGDIMSLEEDLGASGRVMLNTPIVQDRLGVLVSFGAQETPGYIDNVRTGEEDHNDLHQLGGRVAFLIQPTDNFDITLTGLYQRTESDGNSTVTIDPATGEPINGDLTDDYFLPNTFLTELKYYSAEMNWDLGWATLVSATSYADSIIESDTDGTFTFGFIADLLTGTTGNTVSFPLHLTNQKYTQEFRLQSPASDQFEWLVGVFSQYEDTSNSQALPAFEADGTPIPAPVSPLFEAALLNIYREYAAFGNITYHLNEKFDVSAGLRYARNVQDFRSTILPGSLIVPAADRAGHSSEDVLTYSISPRYYITPDVMTYARIATGYQAGGPNVALAGVPPSVDASTITSYEIGLRSQFWDDRATFNLTFFDQEWEDIHVTGSLGGGVSFTANGGTAQSQGVQAETLLRPIDGLTLIGTIAYTDATLTEDIPAVTGFSGDPLPGVPTWSGSLRADYEWALSDEFDARVGAGVRLVGERPTSSDTAFSASMIDDYAVLDLNSDVSNDRYTLKFFIRNATDERAYLSQSTIVDGVSLAATVLQPRMIGIGIDVRM